MQDITDLAFMRLVSHFGAPDYFITEYFRVHRDSSLEKKILRSITENETGKPVFAQMIGMDIPHLVRSAKELLRYPIAGIDLNLGCPAPVVCRKDAGGGLLRMLDHVDEILKALRDVCTDSLFTVKTRIGYHSEDELDTLLELFSRHPIDALAIHGRTVKERYQTPIHPDCLRRAVEALPCPVIANGNVVDVTTARALHKQTSAAGLMIGRGAIRSPWIFRQIAASFTGREVIAPTRRTLLEYVRLLFDALAAEWHTFDEAKHVNKMKKYMIYIAQGLDAAFEHQIRRVRSKKEFFFTCRSFMENDEPLPDLPPENSKLFCGFSALLEK